MNLSGLVAGETRLHGTPAGERDSKCYSKPLDRREIESPPQTGNSRDQVLAEGASVRLTLEVIHTYRVAFVPKDGRSAAKKETVMENLLSPAHLFIAILIAIVAVFMYWIVGPFRSDTTNQGGST